MSEPGTQRRTNAGEFQLTRSATGASLADVWETTVRVILFAAASTAVIATAGIVYVLASNSWVFFQDVGVAEFLFGTKWAPDIEQSFGVLPLVSGTLLVTVGASIIAVPLGIATAIYLSEFAPPRVRGVLKPAIELLAGIPSITFGLFAILVISPLFMRWFDAEVFNAANAIVVLSFMVLPIITSLSEDAIRAVPHELRAGALALGATKWEVTRQVVLPAAFSGVVASILLGFGRAIGETMAVLLAAGARPNITLNIFESIQTMTAFIAQRSQGDVVHEGPTFFSLFAVGLVLFVMTFAINLAAQRIIERYREVY